MDISEQELSASYDEAVKRFYNLPRKNDKTEEAYNYALSCINEHISYMLELENKPKDCNADLEIRFYINEYSLEDVEAAVERLQNLKFNVAFNRTTSYNPKDLSKTFWWIIIRAKIFL